MFLKKNPLIRFNQGIFFSEKSENIIGKTQTEFCTGA